MNRRDRQLLEDYEAVCGQLKLWGGMREPELAAALGWPEERVHDAVWEPLKLGWLVRAKDDSREIRLLPPQKTRR